MKKSIIIIIGCLLLLGCRQEVLEPEQMIQGMFALDDGSGLTNQYLLFDNGYLDIFSSDVPLPIAGKRIWSYDASLFKRDFKQHRYTISGNKIYTSDGPSGEIELKDDILTIGGKKYSVLEGFERYPYTNITLTLSSQDVDYSGGTFSADYFFINPLEGASVMAASQVDWVTNVSLSGTTVSYSVAENNSIAPRTGTIQLVYGPFAPVDFTIEQSGKPVLSLTLNKSTLDLLYGASETLVATADPADAPLQWSSDRPSVAEVDQAGRVSAVAIQGNATITVKSGEKTATCYVTVSYTEVDLGLPSGLKWASYNLGASKPEDYGDYYAWGETITYYMDGHSRDSPCSYWRSRSNPSITGYNWSSYKWCNGSSSTMTKYCTNSSYGTVDNITELQRGENPGETMDDVARAKLGGKWRMPRIKDFEELIIYTDNSWTTYNGVAGWKFTSKTNSSNWIFLPANGIRSNYSIANPTDGYYLSSSLSLSNQDCSRSLNFGNKGVYSSTPVKRFYGAAVRPVSE